MTKYEVVITKSVQKYLDKLPDTIADKLESAMMKLKNEPRPPGCEKMSGRNAYIIRVEITELFIRYRIKFYW